MALALYYFGVNDNNNVNCYQKTYLHGLQPCLIQTERIGVQQIVASDS